MDNGAHGGHTPHVLKVVEQEAKQEDEPVLIHRNLEEENHALGNQDNQFNAIVTNVLVNILYFTFWLGRKG